MHVNPWMARYFKLLHAITTVYTYFGLNIKTGGTVLTGEYTSVMELAALNSPRLVGTVCRLYSFLLTKPQEEKCEHFLDKNVQKLPHTEEEVNVKIALCHITEGCYIVLMPMFSLNFQCIRG